MPVSTILAPTLIRSNRVMVNRANEVKAKHSRGYVKA